MLARLNPYRSAEILKLRYRFTEGSWENLVSKLERFSWRGAIVGPEGSGKTTLLEDLQPRLEAKGKTARWIRLSREFPQLKKSDLEVLRSARAPEIILLDGAEQLGWPGFQFLRLRLPAAVGLVISCHRSGYLPTLLRTRTSPRLLKEIVAALNPEENIDAGTLFHRHRGNIREALRSLYDLQAGRDC